MGSWSSDGKRAGDTLSTVKVKSAKEERGKENHGGKGDNEAEDNEDAHTARGERRAISQQ
jgi:hypothetical protein